MTVTKPAAALDGLLTCAECGGTMTFEPGPHPRYICRPRPANEWHRCQTPALPARWAENLFIGTVMQTVLTERNIDTVLAAANEFQPDSADPPEYRLSRQDIRQPVERPDLLVQALGGTKTQTFLKGFIAEIRVQPGKATVRYTIPLPEDSPRAGVSHQEIPILEETVLT